MLQPQLHRLASKQLPVPVPWTYWLKWLQLSWMLPHVLLDVRPLPGQVQPLGQLHHIRRLLSRVQPSRQYHSKLQQGRHMLRSRPPPPPQQQRLHVTGLWC